MTTTSPQSAAQLANTPSRTSAAACHPILTRRAQVDYRTVSPRTEIDHIDARGRLDPAAMRLAVGVLRRARELIEKYQLQQDEVELSFLAMHPIPLEVRDLLAVATYDANRIAQVLWSGNRGGGLALQAVEEIIAGRPTDIPPDSGLLDLILADDRSFENRLGTLLATTQAAEEEKRLGALLSALRCSTRADETLAELHDRVARMTRMIRDAVELVRDRGGLEAAMAIEPPSHASKIVEFFVRNHPGQRPSAAMNYLQNLAQQFENDDVALAPLLERHGARTVGSVARTGPERLGPFPLHCSSIGLFVEKVREARYAARQFARDHGSNTSDPACPPSGRHLQSVA